MVISEITQKIADQLRGKTSRSIIGISGHGASGKTTFANNLITFIGNNEVNYLNADPYIIGSELRKHAIINYEYQGEGHRYKMTACHPLAHNQNILERDISMIRKGQEFYSINTPYQESSVVSSKNLISIVEGMSVAFVNPEMFDVMIYIYTDGETEFMRRSVRDVNERNTDMNFLKHSHKERRIQYELFMHPFQKNFDIVLNNSRNDWFVDKDSFLS